MKSYSVTGWFVGFLGGMGFLGTLINLDKIFRGDQTSLWLAMALCAISFGLLFISIRQEEKE